MIQPVNNAPVYTSTKTNNVQTEAEKKAAEAKAAEEKAEKAEGKTDGYVKTPVTPPVTYSKPEKLTSDQLKVMSEQRISAFQSMLEGMLGKQADSFKKATFTGLNIGQADQLSAQKAIADGGEWSPDAVAGRILDMAKALSGGDASKFELLKDAVKKGFGEAEKAWGSKLPEITDRTYDKVMKGFDEWEKELNGTSAAE